MPIVKLQFRPGINRESTQYAEGGGWYNCDKVRFRHGTPEKIGGWVRASLASFKGVCRVLKNWTLLNSTDCLFLGTHKKVYIEVGGVFYNITPIRFSDTKLNPITTGSPGGYIQTYTTSVAHNAVVGDYVDLSGASDVDGICTSVISNPFQTTAVGSSVVNVNTGFVHYANVGDTVTFSGTSGFAGIPAGDFNTSLLVVAIVSSTVFAVSVATPATSATTGGGSVTAVFLARLNTEFTVLSIPTSSSFTFQTNFPCSAGGVTGGGTVTANFEVSGGYAFNVVGGGWGASWWSRGPWGSGVTSTAAGISLRIWSVDNFGENLVFCSRNGSIYYWVAASGLTSRAVLLSSLMGATDVPAEASIIRVTNDRHVLAIGATDRVSGIFDPLLIRWCNEEDVINWTPDITDTAGSLRIPTGSYAVAAIQDRTETLIWTDHSLHSLQFIGPPFVFGIQTLAENTDIIGPNAAISINNVSYWMGKSRFWTYSGRVQNLPCTVQRFVFDNVNQDQGAQVYATTNPGFTEVTWLYCSVNANEVDSYVSYHYEDQLWTIGTISRSSMLICPGRSIYPYATDGGYIADDGALYLHEYGYDDGSTVPPSPILSYIESSDFEVQDGNKIAFVDRVIPDISFDRTVEMPAISPSVDLTIEAKKFPGSAVMSSDERSVVKTVTVDQFSDQVWMRLRGRQMRLKISTNVLGVCWLLGTVRINIRQDGVQ